MFGLRRIFFQLFAQTPDVDIHGSNIAAVLIGPDGVQQRFPAVIRSPKDQARPEPMLPFFDTVLLLTSFKQFREYLARAMRNVSPDATIPKEELSK